MKRIIEDYEAKLHSPLDGAGSGKAEWERYGDEEVRISVRFRKVDVADGATIEVCFDGVTIGSAVAEKGRGRLEIESAGGVMVPHGVDGQRVELVHGGRVLLSGTFEPD